MTERDLRGQARVIDEVRRRVDRWRGFELGAAAEPYPDVPSAYEPRNEGERPLTATSRGLLLHWFRREPHQLRGESSNLFKYWPHQRRTVETFIYLYEVCGIRRTQDLYALAGVDPLGPQRDPWAKLGGQLATGSGKTKIMSLLVAWAYLNACLEGESGLGFGKHSVIIAPGLFVRDRLLQDFAPSHGRTPVFFCDPVIPPELEGFWDLKVYTPATCPLELDPREGALVITNRHQLFRSSVDELAATDPSQIDLLFEVQDPRRLEDSSTPLLDRFKRSRGLVVINDEAHGVKDEPEHARLDQRRRETREDDPMSWIRSIRRLNGDEARSGRVSLQLDLSATLFEETGSDRKSVAGKQKTEFKPAELFRHTAVHYGLAEAIQDGIVKKPILERIEVRDKDSNEPQPLLREAATNAWDKYRSLLLTGIERWKKVREQLREEGDPRKPILFILCDDRNEAREVANTLTYGETSRDDLSDRAPVGWVDQSGERLFLDVGPDGVARSTVIEIHIGEKEQRNETDWERVRQAVNAIDREELPDPSGATDSDGRPRMIPNPYNVVVSVMMLKEGWDVRNVKVIVPLRPCDSRTLTEQTLGRGLRKMHAPILDDDGGAAIRNEELYVMEHPSFQTIIRDIEDLVEQCRSDEIEHAREYVAIPRKEDDAERASRAVRLLSFEGVIDELADWRDALDFNAIPGVTPRLPWMETLTSMEVNTFLQRALSGREEHGQTFEFDEVPSYRDFDHVIEAAYAIPLLREMRAGYQHKNGVKAVVRKFLEKKTFALPKGAPLAFDRSLEPEDARLALGNLAREDVLAAVRRSLLQPLHDALTAARRQARARLVERSSADIPSHQALKRNVFDAPLMSCFARAALGNADELRVARLLDRADDVEAWVYNDRDVGYFIEYEWQGHTSRYYPDFIARARIGAVMHNFIIEVKGRYDDRDKAKAHRGRQYCELLAQHDVEPWHYILLIENEAASRNDIAWWESQSSIALGHLLTQQERLPLVPGDNEQPGRAQVEIVPDVPVERRFREAVPVYELAAAAGAFSDVQAPAPSGWANVHASRALDRNMFVARVVGRSMERDIPDGSWGLFRGFRLGSEPNAMALDGRRVLVQLREDGDPDSGGRYTVKRWRVSKREPNGAVSEIELRADNPAFKPILLASADGVRVIAEFLEIVG